MRTRLIIELGILAIVVTCVYIDAGAAYTAQWFPQQGTTSSYSLSWYFTYTNGTKKTDTLFNVYNDTPGVYQIVPSQLDPDNYYKVHYGYSMACNKTTVSINHAYAEFNSTIWNRTVTVKVRNFTISSGIVAIDWFFNHTSSDTINVNLQSDLVQKSGFFNSQAQSFLDYFDGSLQPGQAFVSPSDYGGHFVMATNVIARTENSIIATWTKYPAGTVNGTYVADTSGRVQSFSVAARFTFFWPDIAAYSISFGLIAGGTSGIPGPGFGILFLMVMASVAVLVLKKRKLLFRDL